MREFKRADTDAKFLECRYCLFFGGAFRKRIDVIFYVGHPEFCYVEILAVVEWNIARRTVDVVSSVDIGENDCGIRGAAADGTNFVRAPAQRHGTSSADTAKGRTQPCRSAPHRRINDRTKGFRANGKRNKARNRSSR